MDAPCPLFVRSSFTGLTYHDFQLEFESPKTNCTMNIAQSTLLIQFIRIINTTFSDISYSLYDLTKPTNDLPRVQVFPDDRMQFCIQSAFNTDKDYVTCHDFYMITMLSPMNATFWPLLIIFGYVIIILILMIFSLLVQVCHKIPYTFFSGSITKKLVKTRHILSFVPAKQNHLQSINQSKMDEKKEILKTIDLIAKDCRQKCTKIYSITIENSTEQDNRADV